MKKDLITLLDYTSAEVKALIESAQKLKKLKGKIQNNLKGKSVALVFQKPSNRTRVSFEVAVYELGGNCIYLGPEEINLGKRESTPDVAKTLSRYVYGIVARVFDNRDIVGLAKNADVPVINALCDLYHPCQALADIMTIKEEFGKLKGLKVAYVGDGNNVFHSLMIACAHTGMDIAIACPRGYEPNPDIVKKAQLIAATNKTTISIVRDPKEAVKDAHVIYSDVWVSMGQEAETKKRIKDFEGYRIDGKMIKFAKKNFIFLHCLPAHREYEVSSEVIDGKHSRIFDQAENRLHAQKAVLLKLLK